MLPDKHVLHLIPNGQDCPTHWTQGRSTSGQAHLPGVAEAPAPLSGSLRRGRCGVPAFWCTVGRGAYVCHMGSGYGMCECLWEECSVEAAFMGSECPREGSPPEMSSGLWPALPTLLAALQRLLVAQLQLHVERVTMLPEGNPCSFGQVLGTAAMVVYSSGRREPCGGAELRRWPQILLRMAYALPTRPP